SDPEIYGPFHFKFNVSKYIDLENYNIAETLKKAKKIIEDIIDNDMSKDEVIVKHAENNPQWLINNSQNIYLIRKA
ncbi:15523_t:CDS:1, partial [Cetraspora pellucida]